jgi:hypothetical protein
LLLLLLLNYRRTELTNMSRKEFLLMMSSSKKNGPITLSCVSAHHMFTLGLLCSRFECSLEGSRAHMT